MANFINKINKINYSFGGNAWERRYDTFSSHTSFLGLTFSDFDPAPKRNEKLATADLIRYSAANKLVSLTWLLWVLRNFRRFTLHYILCLLVYYAIRM